MTAAVTASASGQGIGITHNNDTTIDVNPRFKTAIITVPAATTSADTTTFNLWEQAGIKQFMGFRGVEHYPTENSTIILESTGAGNASTTAVSNNVLTITVNGTASASKRAYQIYGL